MGRKELKIHLDNEKECYFAGEQLTGHVTLELNEPTSVLRIILYVKGKGICKVGNSCKEVFYKNDVTLYGTMPGQHAVTQQHPVGKRNYRFNFLLPTELPSSTVEGGGLIKYTLTAKVVFKALLSSDWQMKKSFQVKQILDANIPNYDLEHVHTVKRVASIFTSQKKLEKEDLLMSLQRGVYCPGESIKLNLQYKYVEARKMGLVKCRLNKYKRLNKKENKNIYKKTVKEKNDSKRCDDKIYQRNISIEVPEKLTPTNTLTNALCIEYVLHVKVEGYKEWKLPIVIGTIPFDENRQQQINTQGQPQVITEPSTSRPSAPPSAPSAPVEVPSGNSLIYPTIHDMGGEIQCEFFHPPPYVPENEFDLPPSYDEVLQENPTPGSSAPSAPSTPHGQQLIAAQ